MDERGGNAGLGEYLWLVERVVFPRPGDLALDAAGPAPLQPALYAWRVDTDGFNRGEGPLRQRVETRRSSAVDFGKSTGCLGERQFDGCTARRGGEAVRSVHGAGAIKRQRRDRRQRDCGATRGARRAAYSRT